MQVITLTHPYSPNEIVDTPIVLALGFFDGVHLGHQAVIQRAKEVAEAQRIPLAVMTFLQHPKLLYTNLTPETVRYLTTVDRKKALLANLGVDILYLVDFDEAFGTQSPQQFVDAYIVGLRAQTVVAGYDYTYGKVDLANMQTLPQHAAGRFEVIEVPKFVMQQHKVGSSRIKELLQKGDVASANAALGYIYETSGVVVHGAKRGREMGYPTANIDTTFGEMLPGVGIYAVEFFVEGTWHIGMASIGYNPTFTSEQRLTCEVHVLDFNQMIYGQAVKVRWHHYLRGEVKFDGMESLIAQLIQDEQATRRYFDK
ncbi:MAG: riboflavin biosynthesis protein RibF [Aerococcaceae bacterium]|nr:riboflavin biosynthesis protein RibF [Aerococcaceae bacterium]